MSDNKHLIENGFGSNLAVKKQDRKRGRPKKYDKTNDTPFQEQYFGKNSAAFLSATLYYVGSVLRILKKSINNRGFLIYHYSEDRDFYGGIAEITDIPYGLRKMVGNILQCGPKFVVNEFIKLFGQISKLHGEAQDITTQLLKVKYAVGHAPRAIQFTRDELLEEMTPPIKPTKSQKQQIRIIFEEYLGIVVDIIKCQLEKGLESQYCLKISDIIKEKQIEILQPKGKPVRLTQNFESEEPQTRKIQKKV